MQRRFVWLAIGVLVSLLALSSPAARAEETPIAVPLSYITGLSNWGPTTAIGNALVWVHEAEVRVHVQGLPVLQNQMYGIWLVNTQQKRYLAVGRFNVASDGTALVDVSLPGSLPDGYSMVLITVQTDINSQQAQPSSQFSIAGYFPGNSAVQHQVHYLPDTGQFAQHPPCDVTQTCAPAPAPSKPASTSWLHYLPMLLALLSFAFVLRRTLTMKKK